MGRIDTKRKWGRHGKWGSYQKMSPGNVLEALFWRLTTVKKYKGFWEEIIEMVMGRWKVKLIETFMGINIH